MMCRAIAKPNPSPQNCRLERGVDLPKAVEDPGEGRRIDPYPRVVDGDEPGVAALLHDHADLAVGRRELDRVRKEVHDRLLQTRDVRRYGRIRRHVDGEPHALGPRGGLHGVHGRADHFVKHGRLQVDPQLSGDDPRHVEDVFDEALLGLRVSADHREPVLNPPAIERQRREHVAPAENRVQRSAKLVRDDAQELVFQSVRLLGMRSGLLEPVSGLLLALEGSFALSLDDVAFRHVDECGPAAERRSLGPDDGGADGLHLHVRPVRFADEADLGTYGVSRRQALAHVIRNLAGHVGAHDRAQRLSQNRQTVVTEQLRPGQVQLDDSPGPVEAHVSDRREVEQIGVAAARCLERLATLAELAVLLFEL